MAKKSIRKKIFVIFFIFICLLVFPDYNYFASQKVIINDAHTYLPLKGKDMAAGYLRISNNHSKLIGINSIECEEVNASLHETVIDSDGVIRMEKIAIFYIYPESHVDFMPGAKHIMFSGFDQFEDKKLKCSFGSDIGLKIPFTLEVLSNG